MLDLFIAVPTMTTILLAGYLLGPWLGGAASALGLMLLGASGYALGRRFGRAVLLRLFKDERLLAEVERALERFPIKWSPVDRLENATDQDLERET